MLKICCCQHWSSIFISAPWSQKRWGELLHQKYQEYSGKTSHGTTKCVYIATKGICVTYHALLLTSYVPLIIVFITRRCNCPRELLNLKDFVDSINKLWTRRSFGWVNLVQMFDRSNTLGVGQNFVLDN